MRIDFKSDGMSSDYLTPCVGTDGLFATAGGLALAESLTTGSLVGVMGLLESMDVAGAVAILQETGFRVSRGVVDKGLGAVIASVNDALTEATRLRVDGFELTQVQGGYAQDAVDMERAGMKLLSLAFSATEFSGDFESAQAVQYLLMSESVEIDLLGDADASSRGSLLFIANQALQAGMNGFAFETIEGKYKVPLDMDQMVGLHGAAAGTAAIAAVRESMGIWADGGRVGVVHEWVPDYVVRVLHTSPTILGAENIIKAVNGESVKMHAGGIGAHRFASLMQDMGHDVNALTISEQAEEMGLELVTADKNAGQYYGLVVGKDPRAGLVKYANTRAVALPFGELAAGQARPEVRDNVRMKYNDGDLSVVVVDRSKTKEIER